MYNVCFILSNVYLKLEYIMHNSANWIYALTKWKSGWKQADTCKIYTPFQNFADFCLKMTHFSWFLGFVPTIENTPIFAKMGTSMDLRFGQD